MTTTDPRKRRRQSKTCQIRAGRTNRPRDLPTGTLRTIRTACDQFFRDRGIHSPADHCWVFHVGP